MLKIIKCPCCQNKGLEIDLADDEFVVATGRRLNEFPYKTLCSVCKRTVKYDVKRISRDENGNKKY